MLKTIELCGGCEKEYHVGYRTDDDVWLCAACYIELSKSELSRLTAENAELGKEVKSLGQLVDEADGWAGDLGS